MSQNTPGQEPKDVHAQTDEDLQYSDDVIEGVMTEEQRNDYLEGREIEWTDEQKNVLGEDVLKPGEKSEQEKQVGPNDVLGQIDRTIQVGTFVEQNAEKTNAYQKLRRRAQSAEQEAQELKARAKELEAENRTYKETVEARKSAEETYDFDNPDEVERFIEDERKKAEDRAKSPEPPKPAEDKPAFELVDDSQVAREGPRFFDDDGNSYDEIVKDNPTGKPVFKIKTGDGKVAEVIDEDALIDIDSRMKEQFGDQFYTAMWGPYPNGQPGIMSIWRDRAPKHEVKAVFNAPDPVLATLQVYRSIIAALQQQQGQPPAGPQGQPQPPQPPGGPPMQPQPPQQQPVRKEVRPQPRGFGAGPTTEQDINPKPVDILEVADKNVRDMGDEGRDRWLMEE